MKKLLIPVLLLIAVAAVALWYYLIYATNNNVSQNDNTVTKTEEDFTLKAEYKKENKWEYAVTGTLPNPCYSASVDAVVRESYPEQVSVMIDITQPDSDTICAQVIQNFEYNGTFSASEKAEVSLAVVK